MRKPSESDFSNAIQDQAPVSGLTHDFYRYPARFSPLFARTAIQVFTDPGDVVLDPFIGGGTSLVEARAQGRLGIGVDISSLAVFVTTAKTTLLSDKELAETQVWARKLITQTNLRNHSVEPGNWKELGYQHNISDKSTWHIRKTLELALAKVDELDTKRQRHFARCAILKTGQWALDSRLKIPSASEFRQKFLMHITTMIGSMREYRQVAHRADQMKNTSGLARSVCLHRSVIGIENEEQLDKYPAPALVLTSPPYPGVHVLYHRWQVHGRRETPAPFWISNSEDGNDASYYTFGDRRRQGLSTYYDQVLAAFRSVRNIVDNHTVIIQMLAFADPSWQLPKYLETMKLAGFVETTLSSASTASDGRIWRHVPNRKWYASQKGHIAPSHEVVLFHKAA